MLRLQLIGSAQANRELIPPGDCLRWSILQNCTWLDSADRWYEIHATDSPGWSAIEDLISQNPEKICTQNGIKGTQKYPLDKIMKKFSTRYFTSTFDYMMAHALLEHSITPIDTIDIIGFNFHGAEEYDRQLPGASYWVGVAEGLGIRVNIQEQSALKKAYRLYAFEEHSEINLLNEKKDALKLKENKCIQKIDKLQNEINSLRSVLSDARDEYNRISGARAAIEDTRELLLRGGA